VTTARDSLSFNETISIAGTATAKSSSGLMIEPPVPDWRKRQDRLNWVNSQDFDGVTSEPAQPTVATTHTSGTIGRIFHEAITCAGNAQMACAGVRLRESPLSWRRRRQIILAALRRVVNLFRRK
jgi:hypothetical protein